MSIACVYFSVCSCHDFQYISVLVSCLCSIYTSMSLFGFFLRVLLSDLSYSFACSWSSSNECQTSRLFWSWAYIRSHLVLTVSDFLVDFLVDFFSLSPCILRNTSLSRSFLISVVTSRIQPAPHARLWGVGGTDVRVLYWVEVWSTKWMTKRRRDTENGDKTSIYWEYAF